MAGYSDADIIQNVIVSNAANGIYWQVPAGRRGPRAINNTIFANTGAGIYADGYDTNALIMNNVVDGHDLPSRSAPRATPTLPIIQYNNFFSPAGTTLLGTGQQYHRRRGQHLHQPVLHVRAHAATCICWPHRRVWTPARMTACWRQILTATPALLDGNTNGSPVVDMGAFEFNAATASGALPLPDLPHEHDRDRPSRADERGG